MTKSILGVIGGCGVYDMAMDGTHWVKVRCVNAQRPGQQQQCGVLGAQVGPAVTDRDLVPPGVKAASHRVVDFEVILGVSRRV